MADTLGYNVGPNSAARSELRRFERIVVVNKNAVDLELIFDNLVDEFLN